MLESSSDLFLDSLTFCLREDVPTPVGQSLCVCGKLVPVLLISVCSPLRVPLRVLAGAVAGLVEKGVIAVDEEILLVGQHCLGEFWIGLPSLQGE